MRFVRYAASALVFSTLGMAQTWTGIVVDVMCNLKDVAGHDKRCATSPLCSSTGYGIALKDDKFIKFDKDGNAKAFAAIKAAKKENNLTAKVTGTLENGVIKVDTVEIF